MRQRSFGLEPRASTSTRSARLSIGGEKWSAPCMSVPVESGRTIAPAKPKAIPLSPIAADCLYPRQRRDGRSVGAEDARTQAYRNDKGLRQQSRPLVLGKAALRPDQQ